MEWAKKAKRGGMAVYGVKGTSLSQTQLLGGMQGMFGASVSELYLLNILLINIEDSRSMCDHKKKYTCGHRNCETGQSIIY